MVSFRGIIASLEAEGYANGPAQAKLAHDVILKALEKCGLNRTRFRAFPFCASGLSAAECRRQFFARRILDEHAGGACLNRAGDVRRSAEARADEHLHVRP